MGIALDVTASNFSSEVLQRSLTTPVVVDFYATWCGPCQMLKPLLEKVVPDYDVVLAKVDIDQAEELAQTYGVQGVPDVRFVVNGEVREGFVGVVPEPELRRMLSQLGLDAQLDQLLEGIYQQASEDDIPGATAAIQGLLAQYPQHYGLMLEGANFYLELGDFVQAEALINAVPKSAQTYYLRAKGMKSLLLLRQITQQSAETELDQAFQRGAELALEGNYDLALEVFLNVLMRDRKYRDDGARKAMLGLFDLLGEDHPLTQRYRRQMASALY
jgi:putative thioredoxin